MQVDHSKYIAEGFMPTAESPSAGASCLLYVGPRHRLMSELAAIGVDVHGKSPLSVQELNKCDLMHYEAEKGMEHFATTLAKHGITGPNARTPNPVVMDVGSGFGGPARYIAQHNPTISVVAVELMQESNDAAKELTSRCADVASRVHHVLSDIVEYTSEVAAAQAAPFPCDAAFAVLSLLHCPELPKALAQMRKATKAGGILYVEDFFVTPVVSKDVLEIVRDRVGCPVPITESVWREYLAASGWKDVEFQDVSAEWTVFLGARSLNYETTYDAHVAAVGTTEAARMRIFYANVCALFATGELRGCRIVAKA